MECECDDDDNDNDNDNVSYVEGETKSVAMELIVASEISPDVTELEAELESHHQRFQNKVVVANDEVAITIIPAKNPSIDSKCCIII